MIRPPAPLDVHAALVGVVRELAELPESEVVSKHARELRAERDRLLRIKREISVELSRRDRRPV